MNRLAEQLRGKFLADAAERKPKRVRIGRGYDVPRRVATLVDELQQLVMDMQDRVGEAAAVLRASRRNAMRIDEAARSLALIEEELDHLAQQFQR